MSTAAHAWLNIGVVAFFVLVMVAFVRDAKSARPRVRR
jgi:hypothetical protein